MKIFMVCNVLLDGKDAQTTHVIELLRNLAKQNDTICFAPKPKNIKYKFQEIIYMPVLNKPILLSVSYQLVLFFYLIYYRTKIKPDVIYARHYGLPFSQLIISNLFRIPYIVEINGLAMEEMKLSNRSKLNVCIAKLSEKLNYRHAKKIVAVTQGVKKGIIELYDLPDEKIIVIENGANIDLFKPIDKKKAKKELNFDQDANYICFVGNLAPWQGVEFLIQSAPLILKESPYTKFLIIGEGQMKEELVELADKTGVSDKFIFTGVVPYEEVPKYINASDVCVVPKKPLGSGYSPLKLYEYMACGEPIVASKISGFEILEQQNAGILVEPENPDELAKAIIKLLKDEKLREEMGKNGREYVVKNHSWESVARRVAEVCESSVREHKDKKR